MKPLVAVLLDVTLAVPWPAFAHDEPVHQRMTDYAYHVMLAAASFSEGGPMSARLRLALLLVGIDAPPLSAQTDQPGPVGQCLAQARVRATGAFEKGAPRDVARREGRRPAAGLRDLLRDPVPLHRPEPRKPRAAAGQDRHRWSTASRRTC